MLPGDSRLTRRMNGLVREAGAQPRGHQHLPFVLFVFFVVQLLLRRCSGEEQRTCTGIIILELSSPHAARPV